MSLRFGVVVCCFNGEDRVGRCVESLVGQVPRPDRIVVVDDGSTDATLSVLSRFDVEVVSKPNGGVASARNAGAAALAGDVDVIAYVDDDCVAPPGWFARLTATWETAPSGVCMVAGVVRALRTDTSQRRFQDSACLHEPVELALWNAGMATRVRSFFSQAAMRHVSRPARFVFAPVGANMSVSAAAFAESDGFDERFRSGEEESLARQLLERFGRESVWMDPDLVVWHDFAPSWGEMWRRTWGYGRTAGRISVSQRRLPPVRLTPLVALAVFTLLLPVSRRAAVAAMCAVPFAVHSRWVPWALRRRRGEMLAYPLVLAGMESVTDAAITVGLLSGLRGRR